jgi:hypothetical protein
MLCADAVFSSLLSVHGRSIRPSFAATTLVCRYMRHQTTKLSSSGQEVGGDALFGRRMGFSGTPSDLLPVELGRCGYEAGSDGQVISTMTDPEICTVTPIEEGWSPKSLLNRIATAANPPYHALIDTGALITGMTNLEVRAHTREFAPGLAMGPMLTLFCLPLLAAQVAAYLLDHGLVWCEGLVFLDELDRKMILIRATRRVLKLEQCGIALDKRFAFYDRTSAPRTLAHPLALPVASVVAVLCSPLSPLLISRCH